MDLRPTSNAAPAAKIWQPGGLFSGVPLAALLLSQRALRLSSFVASRHGGTSRPPENSAPIPYFELGSKPFGSKFNQTDFLTAFNLK